MLEQRYDRITVQELIDRADVGRSTFYAHFRDKEDVLEAVLGRLHEHDLAAEDAPGGEVLPGVSLFQHVLEHHALYRSLVRGRAVKLVFQAGQRLLRQSTERRLGALVARGYTLAVPLPILADYLVGALQTVLRWWLEQELPSTPEEVHAIFRRLAAPTVEAVVRPGTPEATAAEQPGRDLLAAVGQPPPVPTLPGGADQPAEEAEAVALLDAPSPPAPSRRRAAERDTRLERPPAQPIPSASAAGAWSASVPGSMGRWSGSR